MQEEELRSIHQVAYLINLFFTKNKSFISFLIDLLHFFEKAHLLKLREKALIEKTNASLAWLDQMKKKAQDKGQDEKMPLILRKEKGIIGNLWSYQNTIVRVYCYYRSDCPIMHFQCIASIVSILCFLLSHRV